MAFDWSGRRCRLINWRRFCGYFLRCHQSILTTVRYTHLTDQTKHHAIDRINGLMDSFAIDWGRVK